MSEKIIPEGWIEKVNSALSNQDEFEEWLSGLPDQYIKGNIVNKYLVDKIGCREGDISWVSRPRYINEFDDELNLLLEQAPRDIIKGAINISRVEQNGFSKSELLEAFQRIKLNSR
ncbi:MAG: hypothetical protein UR93_C0008G0007 [Berkelbacteria bacterium GW2011_GWA2_35_9]|uniref:Uncharacterized protein n=1 Tax=Berkelbacteria bacterium GW2011_GWA2_35_9 TaxID=1618333 RepID=A0A0G0D684_9BACT|nr:MAG: hypothetical protein UR93_C0008G0007 [Berkelbacteria bacterium GW2011_GWA2_35_9]